MPSSTLRILLLDDNPHDRELTLRELRKEFPTLKATEPLDDAEFKQALRTEDFDLVITDFNLKWSNGVDVVRAVKAARPQCPVIMFTATGTQEVAVDAMKAGGDPPAGVALGDEAADLARSPQCRCAASHG
jgi:DNA-binding NtrC family response regulator